jgi:hypothetical protein
MPGLALAHEGHDDAEPPAAALEDVAPRAEAHSDLFELLAVAAGGQLILYLDEYVGNAPVSGAEIEILADEAFEPIAERAPGIYVVPWHPEPGDYELTIAVLAGDLDELLILTIDIPEAAATAEAGNGFLGIGWLSAIIIFLLGVLGTLVLASPARGRRVGARMRDRPRQPDAGAAPPAEATPAE